MSDYILAIDQGTTSSRAIIFDHAGQIVSTGQKEHRQIFPQPGWVEHDAVEIWDNTREVIGNALARANLTRHNIAAVGITNQRETTVVWDRNTGQPVYNAIVWQDMRTQPICDALAADGGSDRFKATTGLPLSPYFAGTKLKWILDTVEEARAKADARELLFGTTDSWVLWNLTGGTDGGVHVTDVTNASRTLFMDLKTLAWDRSILEVFDVPASLLPEIKSSAEVYGTVHGSQLLRHVPVAGILGDQQAATFGQAAFEKQRILITNVPPDYVHIASGLGEAPPLNIIVLPILFEQEVTAVIELASFAAFSPTHQSFLEQLTESIGLVLNTVEATSVTEKPRSSGSRSMVRKR